MKYIKILIILFTILLCMNMRISVEGIEEIQANKPDCLESKMENIIRGAIEDQSWMTSESRQEVRSRLMRYFEGKLLDELTDKCWDFIKQPTDWYSEAKLIDVKVLSNDGEMAVLEAIIRIEDVVTGHNETGKGFFTMRASGDEWRINKMDIQWGTQVEIR